MDVLDILKAEKELQDGVQPLALAVLMTRCGIAPAEANAVVLRLFNHWPSPTTAPYAWEWQHLAQEYGSAEDAQRVADAIAVMP